MKVKALLSKADIQDLQELLGRPVVRLLLLLDQGLIQPSRLRNLLLDLKGSPQLLRDKNSRQHLFGLLTPTEATELLTRLNRKASGDPYALLNELSFRKNSSSEDSLFSFFEEEVPPVAAKEVRSSQVEASCGYPLFDHQRRAVQKVKGLLYGAERRRVLLHMPTGAGKTRTAMNVIADHLRSHEPSLVVWLAYSEELCSQAADEFEKAWKHLGNRPLPLHRNWGDYEFDLADHRDGFVVAGLAKTYSQAMKSARFISRLADRTSLVIIDEAHQATAETYHFVLDFLVSKNPSSSLLGLSATPGRTWNDVDQDEMLARFFHKQKVTLQVQGFDNPVDFLISEGYLARPNFIPLHYSGGVELSGRDLRELEMNLDIPMSVLRRLAEDEQRNLRIVSQVETLTKAHQRIIVFATTVEHATLLACVLRARGYKANAVTGETPKDDRRRLIAGYVSNHPEPVILCNYGVLTTGFDAPRTSAAVIARPTKSLVLYSQMIGRAIRGPRAGGNAEADIVTIIDQALPGFRDPGEAFTNWEDVWN